MRFKHLMLAVSVTPSRLQWYAFAALYGTIVSEIRSG
jgi:hypothetical protein